MYTHMYAHVCIHALLCAVIHTITCYCTQSDEIEGTFVSVSQGRESLCQTHIFSVFARNDAGNSSVSTIMDSIPICEL